MSLRSDLASAKKVFGNIITSRRARGAVARRVRSIPAPAPRSIRIAVYFADAPVNLYQIRQWYAPLAELDKLHRVAIIARSPSATLALWDEAPVPTVHLRSITDLEEFVRQQDIRIVLYVNQNTRNFQMFRYGRMWHVFINHGESDKMYMTTNQFKAYDYSLVAGEAAIDRLNRKLWNFDVEGKVITIGRPQADHFAGTLPYTPDDRTVVLYAPTWEGDRPSAAYGSIASHGVALTDAVLASPRHRLIYRPHPRSGVIDAGYGQADRRIQQAITEANRRDPSAFHVFDDGPDLGWQLAAADVAITDISAMVYDRLATGRPILVTRPVSPDAEIDETGFLGAAEWLTVERASHALEEIDRVQSDEAAQRNLTFWAERHFGDTTPGVPTARFHAAIAQLLEEWDRHAALHSDDEESSESDPLDDEDDEAMPSGG